MKIYQKHLKHLRILNLLSLIVILMTVFYSYYMLRLLPDVQHLPPKTLSSTDMIMMNKSLIWKDIRLMFTSYLLFSLITVFLELTPFRYSSGFHKAQFVSIVNVGISSVFAYTIISTVNSAT